VKINGVVFFTDHHSHHSNRYFVVVFPDRFCNPELCTLILSIFVEPSVLIFFLKEF